MGPICVLLSRRARQTGREIIEACNIWKLGGDCVTSPVLCDRVRLLNQYMPPNTSAALNLMFLLYETLLSARQWSIAEGSCVSSKRLYQCLSYEGGGGRRARKYVRVECVPSLFFCWCQGLCLVHIPQKTSCESSLDLSASFVPVFFVLLLRWHIPTRPAHPSGYVTVGYATASKIWATTRKAIR